MRINPIISGQEAPRSPYRPIGMGSFTAIARGIGGLGQELSAQSAGWEQTARYEQAIEEKKRQFDNVTETTRLRVGFESDLKDLHANLEKTNPENADLLLHKFNSEKNLLLQKYRSDANQKGPEISNLFERESIPVIANAEIAAKRLQDQKWVQKIQAAILGLKLKVENDAPQVNDPSGMIQFWNAFAREAVNEGMIKPEEYVKLQQSMKENISFNKIKLDAYIDPLATMEKFGRGDYKDLSPEVQDKATRFLEARIRAFEADERRKEADIKRAYDENERQLMNAMQKRIDQGEDIYEMSGELRDLGLLSYEKVKTIRAEQDSRLKAGAKEEMENDPETVDWAINGLYGSRITISEGELRFKRDAGLINQKTYQQYMEHRTSRMEALRKEGESKEQVLRNRRYAQAEQVLTEAMRTEGPAAAVIDRGAKQLYSQALTELWNLDQEGQNPMDVVWGLVDRYSQALETHKWVESRKIRETLVIPDKLSSNVLEMYDWLEINKDKMPKATYLQQKNLLRTIESLEVRQETEKAMKPKQPQGKK